MRWMSSTQRYGTVARTMHWVTALAIFALLGSGLAADQASGHPAAAGILRFHVLTGIGVLVLTVLRILWWAVFDHKPPASAGTPRWQARAARAVHMAFYLVIVGLGASGVATIALSGAGTILFGGQAGPLPEFEAFAPRAPHGLAAWLMIGLVALHVGAALYHQFVLGDRLLARMGIGRSA